MDFEFSTMNDGTSYAVVGYNGYDTEINIPDTYKGIPVTMIGGYAFQDNTMIKSVSFSANLIGVGDYAFDGCTSLTTVTFRDSDSGSDHCQIFENAFSDCASLKTVNMPSHQVTMATYAFANCEQLSNINLSNIYRIGDGAFLFCNSLSKVNINAQYIDDCAFSFCNGLKSVKVSNAEIAYAAFEYCDLLEKFTGVNVISIGSRAFGDCTNLTDVDLSESPSAEIASDAFDGSMYSYGVSGAHPYAATNFLGMTVDEAVSILGYNYEDHYMQGAMGHYYQDYGLAIPYGEASINAPYITSIEAFGSQYVSNGYGYMDKIHAGMSFREIFDVIGEQELSIDNMFGMVSFSVSYDNVRFYFYIMKSFDEGDDILGAVPSCMVSLV